MGSETARGHADRAARRAVFGCGLTLVVLAIVSLSPAPVVAQLDEPRVTRREHAARFGRTRARAAEAAVATSADGIGAAPRIAYLPWSPSPPAGAVRAAEVGSVNWAVGLTTPELDAVRASAWAELGAGVALLVGGIVSGVIAVPVGVASERRDVYCAGGAPWFSSSACPLWGGIVGYDDGLLGASLALGGVALVSIFVGGVGLMGPAIRRLRAVGRALELRVEVSMCVLPDSYVGAFTVAARL